MITKGMPFTINVGPDEKMTLNKKDKTMKPYFVILNHQNPDIHLPLVDDDDQMMFFESENFAIAAAEGSMLGSAFGFEVFELGSGS